LKQKGKTASWQANLKKCKPALILNQLIYLSISITQSMLKQPFIYRSVFLSGFLFLCLAGFSQDSTKRRTIEITSTFKPVLREAVKINFNAAPPTVDSSRQTLNYNIPVQNLYFKYQPMLMKPVALFADSATAWKYSNYIKAGVGNVHIPFLQAGFSFGDGTNSTLNVFANHVSSKGKLPFQKSSETGVKVAGSLKTASNLEWNGNIGFKSNDYFFYGFRPDSLKENFTKDDLRQRFQQFEGNVSMRNMEPTKYGLNYSPSLKINVISGKNAFDKATEANTVLNLPLQKTFGDNFAVNLGFTADLTTYRPKDKDNIQNNLFYFSPSVVLKMPNVFLQGGLTPSWDNGNFKMLPNIMADITTNDKQLTLQLGWIGYYDKGSYQRFVNINPWITQPDNLLNTRVQEIYGGIKGSLLDNFTYSARMGFETYKNMALFVNDSIDGKTFQVVYTSSMEILNIHGEIGYTKGETFNATAALTLNRFSKIKDHTRAYGLLPFEFKTNARWMVLKDVTVKADLFAWDGAAYRTKTKESRKGETGFDLNAGLEFKVAKQVNLWVQMNNILNNKYERWNQYEVYGFNLLGGVVYSF
jgi:hypothetical protein